MKLTIHPCPIKKQSIMVLSWPYKANWDVLNSLQNGCYVSCNMNEMSNIEETVLLFSLFKVLEFKLSPSPLDANRAKFSWLKCNVQKDNAIIIIGTEPTFSATRKVLSIVSKNIQPDKLGPVYKKYVSLLGTKMDLEHFGHSVNQMSAGLKNLDVFITGTIKVSDENEKVLKNILDTINPQKYVGKTSAPDHKKSSDTHDEIKCGSKLEAFLTQQLLQTSQIETHVRDGNLIPVTGTSSLETVLKKFDNEKVKKFVEQKLLKLGEKLPTVMVLMCSLSGYFTVSELQKLPSSYTLPVLTALINKGLK